MKKTNHNNWQGNDFPNTSFGNRKIVVIDKYVWSIIGVIVCMFLFTIWGGGYFG